MNSQKNIVRLFLWAVTFASISVLPTAAFEVGDRVLCSHTCSNKDWNPGTIVKKDQYSYTVKLDKREGQLSEEVYSLPLNWVKAGTETQSTKTKSEKN